MFEFLGSKFMEKYEGVKPPMTKLGEFVNYRTYSRWLEDEGKRETWLQTVKRAVNYNIGLELKHRMKNDLEVDLEGLNKKAEELFDACFNLRVFLSGRTYWVGGTPVAEKFPLANFNCAFTTIESFKDFGELFYLLMIGAGVGFRATDEEVNKISKYRNVDLKLQEYREIDKRIRKDLTEFRVHKNKAIIIVGDSKEGWVSALELFFNLITSHLYKNVYNIEINFDNVRPKGERLKTFGGTASGFESLRNMFEKIKKVLDREDGKLTSLGVLDICNIIGENVVVGGVRRTSEIGLCMDEDKEFIDAKNKLYELKDGILVVNEEIAHREMSNNSILFYEKPSRGRIKEIFNGIKVSGEPGFYNMDAVNKRLKKICKKYGMKFRKRMGTNPCGEVTLDSKQTCNLVTNNVMGYVKNGKLNVKELLEGFRLSAMAGIRMTLVELEMENWNILQKRDRLLGVSLTGWFDMVNEVGMDEEGQRKLLRKLRREVRKIANDLAEELGIERPLLTTTVKPEGTLSKLPTVSEGVHYNHSPYYIRRVRINEDDALCKMAKALGWRMNRVNDTTMAIEFPVKAPKGKTKYDVSAIQQLENYRMFMDEYVEHNASITVSVRDYEWDEVEQWVYDNWEDVVGVTFIGLDTNYYPNMPNEAITEEEYESRVEEMADFDEDLLNILETGVEINIVDDGCDAGICPIR